MPFEPQKQLAKGGRLAARRWRSLAESDLFFGANADKAVAMALRLKARDLGPFAATDAINAYQ